MTARTDASVAKTQAPHLTVYHPTHERPIVRIVSELPLGEHINSIFRSFLSFRSVHARPHNFSVVDELPPGVTWESANCLAKSDVVFGTWVQLKIFKNCVCCFNCLHDPVARNTVSHIWFRSEILPAYFSDPAVRALLDRVSIRLDECDQRRLPPAISNVRVAYELDALLSPPPFVCESRAYLY